MKDITQVLAAVSQGESGAAEQLLPLVYAELRRLAASKLSREPTQLTLQATALVHEAYLRLVGDGRHCNWESRSHFFAAAAEAMRRVLVESARKRRSQKRGGGRIRVAIDDLQLAAPQPPADLEALDEALRKLAERHSQHAKLVELRYFAGMTLDEAAEVLGLSATTAKRFWAYARAWLYRELARDLGSNH
jgi:RNA polymerase sigma factor (TIGR02999 family)